MTKEEKIILGRILAAQDKIQGFEKAFLKRILKQYESAREEILKGLGSIKGEWTKERQKAVLAEVEIMISQIGKGLEGPIKDAAAEVGAFSYDQTNAIVSWDNQVSGFDAVGLSKPQIVSMLSTQKVGGKDLSEWIGDALAPDQEIIKNSIINGYIQGHSGNKIVQSIRGELGAEVSKQHIESVTRSYIQAINVKAQEDVFEANQDVVEKVEWSAIMEGSNIKTGRGTCARCQALDGQQWETDNPKRPPMPLHVRCRCIWLPVTSTWKELGFDIEENEKVYKPWVERDYGKAGDPIIEYGFTDKNYSDWWWTKSKEWQDNSIGPVRAEYVRSGAISFDKLVVKRPIDLRQLKKRQVSNKKYEYGDLILIEDLGPRYRFDPEPIERKVKKEKVLKVRKKTLDKKYQTEKKRIEKNKPSEMPTMDDLQELFVNDIGIKSARKKQTLHNKKKKELRELKKKTTDKTEIDNYDKKIKLHVEESRKAASLVRKRKAEALEKAIKPPKGGKIDWTYESYKIGGSSIERDMDFWKDSFEKIEDLFHPDILKRMPGPELQFIHGSRASHLKEYNRIKKEFSHKIKMGRLDPAVLAHEFSHGVETFTKKFGEKALAFRERRTIGEALTNIGNTSELGFEDRFFSHYVGRVYDYSRFDRKAYLTEPTEIISMGIQEMFSDPMDFYENDKEYFELILQVMWDQK